MRYDFRTALYKNRLHILLYACALRLQPDFILRFNFAVYIIDAQNVLSEKAEFCSWGCRNREFNSLLL